MQSFKYVVYVIFSLVFLMSSIGFGWYEQDHQCCDYSEIVLFVNSHDDNCSSENVECCSVEESPKSCCESDTAAEQKPFDDCCTLEFHYSKIPVPSFSEQWEMNTDIPIIAHFLINYSYFEEVLDVDEHFWVLEPPPKLVSKSFLITNSQLRLGDHLIV